MPTDPRPGVPPGVGALYCEDILPPLSPFLGRVDELSALRALLSGARSRVGGALLVTGDPGIGKTTLLTEATRDAADLTVVSITGYEVESGFPYAALQRLGRPLSAWIAALPARQREALLVAAGLEDGPPPERALVGLAALSLLAGAGDAGPIVCIVDDAHHIDPESLEVLGFVARRLAAEAVAIVFASRDDPNVSVALAGVPTMRLDGLDLDAATKLLSSTVGTLDPAVVAEIIAETGGNPLALTDLSADSDAYRITAAAFAGAPTPLGPRLEAHYSARVDALTPDARRWLLLAAAESTGDIAIVRTSAEAMGLADASAELERSGLLELRDTVRFRHPMVRSAVYGAAADADRRRVHSALRDATAARSRRSISAWHAAAAAIDVDAAVAAELVALADEARARGGLLSAARLLLRAGDLTEEGTARDELIVRAAESAVEAGAARLALDLLDRVDVAAVPRLLRGRSLVVRAMSALFLAEPDGMRAGAATVLEAADALHGVAPHLEQRLLLQALNLVQATEISGDGLTLTHLGERFRAGAEVADGPLSVVLRALGAIILDPYDVAAPHLEAALAMLESLDDSTLLEFSFVAVCPAVGLWDADAASRLLRRAAAVAQDAGALRELDAVLWVLSAVELTRVDPRRAGEYLAQAGELRRAVGYADALVVNAAHLAWIGVPLEEIEEIVPALSAGGWAGVARMANAAIAIAEAADGAFASAYARLADILRRPFLQSSFHHIAEIVEPAVRSGHREAAEDAAAQLGAFAAASGRPWILGMHERALALLAHGADAERHHLASLAHLDATEMIGEQARARLLYGEWLRRQRRRREGRDHLHAALIAFERVGATRFAARARRELEASGEVAVVPEAEPRVLTHQESVIARMAADGATNADIGAALLISANTVDYHLRKVFRRLGVTSRRQLADAMRADGPAGT